MSQAFHVIFGTGPAGIWTARALREMGHAVRAVNRTGRRPGLMPADVELVARRRLRRHGRPPTRRAARPRSTRRSTRRTTSGSRSLPAAAARGDGGRARCGRALRVDRQPLRLWRGHGRADGAGTAAAELEEGASAPGDDTGRPRWRTRAATSAWRSCSRRTTTGRASRMSQFGERTFRPMLAGKTADVGRQRRRPALVRLHRGCRPSRCRARHARRGDREDLVCAARAGDDAAGNDRRGLPSARHCTAPARHQPDDDAAGRPVRARRPRKRRDALPVHGAVGGIFRGHRVRLRPGHRRRSRRD